MFFFLSLRESSTRPGTIEPDILPNTPSSAISTNSTHTLLAKPLSTLRSSTYSTWLTTWDPSEPAAVLRKLVCILSVVLHVPMNVLSVASWGLSLWVVLGFAVSVLNLVGVAVAMWKLEEMRGARWVWDRLVKRIHFDFIILALFLTYGFSFGMFVFARLRLRTWITFLQIIWPCLVATDVVCFISGWVATWRDVTLG